MRPGPRNAITDVSGLLVGQAQDAALRSGVTVLTGAAPFTASVDVMGGAPGTRETDLLAPDRLVQAVDALVLSGGSAFGLDAASGVADALRAAGRGFEAAGQRVPIVPAAILFDLGNGGDKGWSTNPYAALGRAAFEAAGTEVALGSHGAGYGATTATLRGGIGTASLMLESGHMVGALVAVNAVGSATIGDGAEFWAAPWEIGAEFGGRGLAMPPGGQPPTKLARAGESTTIAIVATNAALDKPGCRRMAVAAQDGIARALLPSHTPLDGDLVFAAATGARPLTEPVGDALWIGHAAATCLARAIARAVFHAAPGGPQPCWQERFGP
ncbi:D-aminopeptidase [Limimaricola soesokkakensis]|uniref:D-aminopeptidase n=1 Tax=Limimaricola soesokkakensis TaxID=1343159 RepID=A0A1X6ZJN2_9RHOB|nr:P1 family peptidase [Limimaricola soesokkakensis]PSK84897.1 D-aminopeptidase [Limimaricola soesokkakensis]SLN52801.1 Peptidase family S58 [Limimaricola soesokkakensis]